MSLHLCHTSTNQFSFNFTLTGAYSLPYGGSFGHAIHSGHLKSISQLKKELAPALIEKYVAVPVHVKVPVDRPVPVHVPRLVPVPVEKAVPFPIKVNVPQPYPVYKKIAVPIKVPVDRPVPVQVLKPYPVLVEKQVPYPVDKPVPVPVRVPVDRPYPVYISVEKSTTEKPAMAQFKWVPEKSLSLSSGKSMAWLEKPDMLSGLSFKLASAADETDNEKLFSSLLEAPEPSESDIILPENYELEIKK